MNNEQENRLKMMVHPHVSDNEWKDLKALIASIEEEAVKEFAEWLAARPGSFTFNAENALKRYREERMK